MLDVGELLVRRGTIAREHLDRAMDVQRKVGGTLPAVLAEMGVIGEEKLLQIIAQHLGVQWVRAEVLDGVRSEIAAYVTRDLAEQYRAVPVRVDGNIVYVCVSNPERLEEVDDLGRAIGRSVKAVLVSEAGLAEALERLYGIRPEMKFSRATQTVQPTERQVQAVSRGVERTGIIRIPDGLAQVAPPTPSPANDIIEMLASANSPRDIVVQAFRFFAEMFPEVAILGFHKGRVQVLLVGNRAGVRPLSIAVEAALQEDSLIWSVLTRPQICFRTNVTDRTLADLCRASGLIPADVALIPAFDSGRPVFLVVGQGSSEAQVHASFETTKDFLTKVGKALKIVALRNELRAG